MLHPLILEHIVATWVAGLHMMSIGWASYANIATTGYGIYMHSSVMHEWNFLGSEDSHMHTRSIENLCLRATRNIRRQYRASRELFPSYLHEFIY